MIILPDTNVWIRLLNPGETNGGLGVMKECPVLAREAQ